MEKIKKEVKPILNTMIVSDVEDFSEEEDELNERYEMFENLYFKTNLNSLIRFLTKNK